MKNALKIIRYGVGVCTVVSVYIFAGLACLFLFAIGDEKHGEELHDDIFL